MSLKAFHLLFMILSVILAAFIAAWAVEKFRLAHEAVYAVTAVVALAASGSLVWYINVFQRKTKNL
jgi:hypothetical protein